MKDNWGILHNDYGIDAMHSNLTASVQMKYYAKGTIKWRDICTFYCSSLIVCQAGSKILIHTPTSTVQSMGKKLSGLVDFPVGNVTFDRFRKIATDAGIAKDVIERVVCEVSSLWIKVIPVITSAPIPTQVVPVVRVLPDMPATSEIVVRADEVKCPPFELRPYQIDAVETFFGNNEDEIAIQAACGCGKTVIFCEIIRRLLDQPDNEANICVMVPSLLILFQTSDMLRRFGIEHIKIGTGFTEKNLPLVDEHKVVVCVYNSVDYLVDIQWSYVFVDEAHHIQVPEYYDEKSANGFANKIMALHGKKCLLSATLTDPDWSYGMREAIEAGWLADYDVIIPWSEEPFHPFVSAVAILRDRVDFMHVLAYCNKCETAKAFAAHTTAAGISTMYFDGDTPLAQRRAILDNYQKGAYRILCTVGVLKEAIDIPCADTCMFIDERDSPVQIIQCVGRIMRKCVGKTLGHVVLPAGSADDTSTLAKFFRALCVTDTLFAKKGRATSRINCVRLCKKEDHVEVATEQMADCKMHADIYDSIGNALEDRSWQFKFGLLQAYVKEFHVLPERKTIYRKVPIGKWCGNQRSAYNGLGRYITQERISQLETVSGWWWMEPDTWPTNFALLQSYVKEFGKLPAQRIIYRKEPIGKWCNNQRSAYKGCAHRCITPERIMLLETVPGWYWSKWSWREQCSQ
jgi:hypothetical protein